MHPNPTFRKAPRRAALEAARSEGFGMLAVSLPSTAPLMSHVPFLLSDDGQSAELHLVRSNPIARLVGPLQARLAVQGPHGYVSPDWYETEDQVPTWNYVAVHLTGRLERMPQETLPDVLARLSDHFEARLLPKPIWTLGKMSEASLSKMLRQIVPYKFRIDDIDSTFKLGQNKPDDVRLRAADAIAAAGLRTDAPALAELMRKPPEES